MVNETKMKAVLIHGFGGPEVLKYEETVRPAPEPGEVLVKVRAAGINPVDTNGRSFPIPEITGGKELPIILGWDMAGEVVELGEGVDQFSIGDKVYGMPRFPGEAGAYAEYLTAPVTDIALKSEQLTFEEAAAIPMAGLTAWQGLIELANLQPGQTILITGGSGGVGHFAVQIAKWKGAKIIATTSGPNVDFLRQLGADEVIDYTRQPVSDIKSEVDVVFDTIGGEVLEQAFGLVKKGGVVVSTPLQKGIVQAGQELAPKYGVKFFFTNVHTSGEQLGELANIANQGLLKPHLEKVYPLEQVAEAHKVSQAGHVRGKLVLEIS